VGWWILQFDIDLFAGLLLIKQKNYQVIRLCMTEQYFFRVNGMENGSCEERIEKAVKSMKGIDFVEADYESSMVITKGSATSAEISDVINVLGYNAILVAE